MGESDIAPLFRRFTGNEPKEIQIHVCAAEVILSEGESMSAWGEVRV